MMSAVRLALQRLSRPWIAVTAVSWLCAALMSGASQDAPATPDTSTPALVADVVVVDRTGEPVDDLAADDFVVVVDGGRRRVVSVRFVTRGPGALTEAGILQATTGSPLSRSGVDFAAEHGRTVVVVIDRSSIAQGQEKDAAAAIRSVVDRLGLDDRVGVARLPPLAGRTISLGRDRPMAIASIREAMAAGLVGLPRQESLLDLRALLVSLRGVPGRKTVLLFSAGLTGVDPPMLEETAREATRAHAVIVAFGLRTRFPVAGAPDDGQLATLARSTGGQFVAPGQDADQATRRVFADLSSCYVLGIEGPAPEDVDARLSMRVAVSRPGATVRAPAWLVSRPDAADTRPGAEAPGATIPEGSVARARQLRRILARAADYVHAYQREYSSLVAEEDYEQSELTLGVATRNVRLRSDLLLVRVDRVAGWVSFRDVFEVNGKPVRERDERLQRLFLDPSVESQARLSAIQSDSSRYNLGRVRRTVNVPLFPLAFLEFPNLPRFQITLKGMRNFDGFQAWELDYQESASPTVATTEGGLDQPARGRFLIDPLSGAVVWSHTIFGRSSGGQMEYDVRHRHDEALGLWLPAEMRETYSVEGRTQTTGIARYRNFRRFQVHTNITGSSVPK